MIARKKTTWLDTALRAQQAKTLDQHYRVHESQAAREQAALVESEAARGLHALAASWRHGRDAGRLGEDLDGLYRRYHAHLHRKADEAAKARIERELALDSALLHLRQNHALQQALDRTVGRRDRRLTKDALSKERDQAAEAWLLDRIGRRESNE